MQVEDVWRTFIKQSTVSSYLGPSIQKQQEESMWLYKTAKKKTVKKFWSDRELWRGGTEAVKGKTEEMKKMQGRVRNKMPQQK